MPRETAKPAPEETSGDARPDEALVRRLRDLGLHPAIERVRTHTNRTVMVSLSRGTLRLHRGYAAAPDRVLQAIVRFLKPHTPRALRRVAEREFLAFPVEQHAPPSAGRRRRAERPQPGDVPILTRLIERHAALNGLHFGGALGEIPIRLSGRMKTRLGELSVDLRTSRPIEIAISRRHVERHSWEEVEHTLLHEMVHQWQAESGLPVDHRGGFRRKAREVGILPAARRRVPPRHGAGRVADGARAVARERGRP